MPNVKRKDLSRAAWIELERQAREQGVELGPKKRGPKTATDPSWWLGPEAGLQKAVGRMLLGRGYLVRNKRLLEQWPVMGAGTSAGILMPYEWRGWQIHVQRAIGNPYLLDVLLLGKDGRWLEFELKNATGRVLEIQLKILATRRGPRSEEPLLVRSVEEAESLVRAWEDQAGS